MKLRIVIIVAAAALIVSCVERSGEQKPAVSVTIAPLGWVVTGLVDTMATLNVVVPAGASPESYEPTARQSEQLARSTIVFSIGLIDFERQIENRLKEVASTADYVRLADSLTLRAGECSHDGGHEQEQGHDGHDHGAADPHVWLSPKMMHKMTSLMAEKLIEHGVDSRQNIERRRDSLLHIIELIDSTITKNLSNQTGVTFAIVHPSLGYYATDYGLEQLSIETDGKEPSGQRIKALVDTIRAKKVEVILHSGQDPATAARVIATETGIAVEEFDPMGEKWDENIMKISKKICRQKSTN